MNDVIVDGDVDDGVVNGDADDGVVLMLML